MSDIKKVSAEVVEEVVDPKILKAFEKIAENTFLAIQKRDYRATMVQRTESADLPDSQAALIHIDESDEDILGNPRELDIKGHISPWEAFLFKRVSLAQALVRLKNWAYFEEPVYDRMGNAVLDKNGKQEVERIPINLAQIDMLSKKRLNLSVDGRQGWKHIKERYANSGIDNEPILNKAAGFLGFRKERTSKEELEAQYGKQ